MHIEVKDTAFRRSSHMESETSKEVHKGKIFDNDITHISTISKPSLDPSYTPQLDNPTNLIINNITNNTKNNCMVRLHKSANLSGKSAQNYTFFGQLSFNINESNRNSIYKCIIINDNIILKYKKRNGYYVIIDKNISSNMRFIDLYQNLEISSETTNSLKPKSIVWDFDIKDSILIFSLEINNYNSRYFSELRYIINNNINVAINYISQQLRLYESYKYRDDIILLNSIQKLNSHFNYQSLLMTQISDDLSLSDNSDNVNILFDTNLLARSNKITWLNVIDNGTSMEIPISNADIETNVNIIFGNKGVKNNVILYLPAVNDDGNNNHHFIINEIGSYLILFNSNLYIKGTNKNYIVCGSGNLPFSGQIKLYLSDVDTLEQVSSTYTIINLIDSDINTNKLITIFINLDVTTVPFKFSLRAISNIVNFQSLLNLSIGMNNTVIDISKRYLSQN